MNELIFKIKNIKTIKEEINFILKSKQINILIGTNGVGKTSFLDAISYFANNDDRNDRLDTETTSFCKLNPSTTLNKTVTYNENLKDFEVKKIISILKEFNIRDDFLPKKLSKNLTASKKSFFGNLYVDELNKETILSTIINKILETKKELLGEKFIYKNDNQNWLLNPKNEIEEILEYDHFHQREVIENIIKKIYIIEDIFKIRPTVNYIKNAELENKTEFIYNLDSILKQAEDMEQKDKELMGMITFLSGIEGINIIHQICNLSDTEKDLKSQMKLKDNFREKATNKLKELFDSFDIYAYPEVEIDNKRLIIKVKDRNNYWYNASETAMNSSGYISFFEILFKLESCKSLLNADENKTIIILADEPDKNLHPILQYQLSEYIRKTIKDYSSLFVVYATHSPFLIDPELDNVNIVNRNEKGSSYLINTNDSKDINGTLGWYILDIAKVLSNLSESHPLKLLKNKFNVHYEGDENDDLMLLKQKIGYQVTRYNLISIGNITNEEQSEFTIVKNLVSISDLDDIDLALDKNQRVLILKEAYDN